MVRAVEDGRCFAEDLLVGAEKSREERSWSGHLLARNIVLVASHHRTSGLVYLLRRANSDGGVVGFHHVRVDLIADFCREIHEAEALGWF